ncbi:MAG: hypothetical protein ABI119_13025 [Gemmatimonadaceae bacterium]
MDEDLAGRSSQLKEATIGNGLYGRSPTYDTKEDAIVRVNANRLRLRLEEHYRTRASPDVQIAIEKGSYIPHYTFSPEGKNRSALAESQLAITAFEQVKPPEVSDGVFSSDTPSTKHVGSALRREWIVVASVLCMVILVATSVGLLRITKFSTDSLWRARPMTRRSGAQNFASFSPDGKRLAFVWLQPNTGENRIFLETLESGDIPRPLTRKGGNDSRPAWSPNGKQIAFVRQAGGNSVEILLADAGTGNETSVSFLQEPATWLCRTPKISWTTDGRSLITTAASPGTQACGLVSIDLKSRTIRTLTTPGNGALGDVEAAVSPRGDEIAFLRNISYRRSDLFAISATGGPAHRITHDDTDNLGFAWEPTGEALLAASRRGDGILRLWKVARDGTENQWTDGSSAVAFPAISPDGNRVVFTDYRNVVTIVRWENQSETEVISDGSDNSDVTVSPDGRFLLYSSDRSGNNELWISERNGTNTRRLADVSTVAGKYASWSADGQRIAFECHTKDQNGICIIPSVGGEISQVTDGHFNCILPTWANDGKSIYYASNKSGEYQIYRQDLDGSSPRQMTVDGGIRAVEAIDGHSLYVHRGPRLTGLEEISLRLDGPRKTTIVLPQISSGDWSDWSVSKDAIFYVSRGKDEAEDYIIRFDLRTHDQKVVVAVKSVPNQSGRVFSVTLNGEVMFLEKGLYMAQLEMMTKPN